MGSINIFKPLFTFPLPAPSRNLSTIGINFQETLRIKPGAAGSEARMLLCAMQPPFILRKFHLQGQPMWHSGRAPISLSRGGGFKSRRELFFTSLSFSASLNSVSLNRSLVEMQHYLFLHKMLSFATLGKTIYHVLLKS